MAFATKTVVQVTYRKSSGKIFCKNFSNWAKAQKFIFSFGRKNFELLNEPVEKTIKGREERKTLRLELSKK